MGKSKDDKVERWESRKMGKSKDGKVERWESRKTGKSKDGKFYERIVDKLSSKDIVLRELMQLHTNNGFTDNVRYYSGVKQKFTALLLIFDL